MANVWQSGSDFNAGRLLFIGGVSCAVRLGFSWVTMLSHSPIVQTDAIRDLCNRIREINLIALSSS